MRSREGILQKTKRPDENTYILSSLRDLCRRSHLKTAYDSSRTR